MTRDDARRTVRMRWIRSHRADPLDVACRLDEFKSLQDGWLEGHGVAPVADQLDWLAKTFDASFARDLPLPYAYPTEDGGVRFEWDVAGGEASLEVDISTHQSWWTYAGAESAHVVERALDLNDPDSWSWLAGLLRGALGEEEAAP